jgi:hypothetical protein
MSRRWTIPLAVAAVTSLCFLPAVSGTFLNWDDDVNFRHNSAYRGLGWEQLRWAFTSVLFGHYIPLTRLTFSVNYALGGLDPLGYHLLNVLLHGANAALLYVVARRVLSAAVDAGRQDRRNDVDVCAAAAVAALVFGVHPLRVEPVAWITGRADLLCTTFVLASSWAYLRTVEATGPARRRLLLASTLALAAALLSKGAALPLPAAFLLLDVYPLRRPRRERLLALVREKLPLLVVAAAAGLVNMYASRHGAVLTAAADHDAVARLTVAAYSFVMSAARFVWPSGLLPLYEMPGSVTPLQPRFALAVGALVLVTTVLIVLRRRWPGGLAAWTFSALMLAPISVAVRKTTDLAPDRYSYLAGLGFALAAGGAVLGVAGLVRRGVLARRVGQLTATACVVAIVGLGVVSWSTSEMWRDPETLWRWAIEWDPACSVCHSKLGESVLGDPARPERAAEAEGLFRRAITLRPDRPGAYFNLGTALLVQGRYVEAESPLQRFIERVPRSALGPERLGRAYLLQQRFEAAIPLLRTALTRQPDMPEFRAYLSEALEGRARELEARGLVSEAAPFLAESRRLR